MTSKSKKHRAPSFSGCGDGDKRNGTKGHQGERRTSGGGGGADLNQSQSCSSPVSVKDLAVLVTLATFLASGLVTLVFGYDNLMEKCTTLDLTYVLITLFLFATGIALLTYTLLRMTVQYLVYVGLGVIFAIVNPCHPSKVKKYLERIFTRAKNKQKNNN